MAASNDGGGVGTLVLLAIVAAVILGGNDDEEVPKEPEVISSAPMPDLIGMKAREAEEFFDEWTYEGPGPDNYSYESVDYSALDRWSDDNWVVVDTNPRPGDSVGENTEVRFFTLKRSEIRWFKKNSRMPAIDSGVATRKVLGRRGPFAGVRGLIVLRYTKGEAPKYAWRGERLVRRPERGVANDPRVESAREREPRDSLKEADTYDTLSVGTLPRHGSRLRLGRVMTVTVRDKPEEPAPASGSGDWPDLPGGSYGDDDDDFNVPGWICPTRFC